MTTRVLVIGATGLLGREVCNEAMAAGLEVVGTHVTPLGSVGVPHPGGIAHLDLRDSASLGPLVESCRVDAVVNAAYVVRGPDLVPVTADAPGQIADVCAGLGIRFVQLSSDVVFDGTRPAGERYGEDDVPNPLYEYGRAKLRCEQSVAERDPGAAIVRTSLLYPGPHTRAVHDALSGSTSMTFYTDEIRNPCVTTDLARFLLWLLTAPEGRAVSGVVHAAGADAVSRFEFARLVAADAGLDPDLVRGGPSPDGGARRPRNCALRSDRGLPGLPLAGVHARLGPWVS